MVSDELAVVTLVGQDVPQELTSFTDITLPALDDREKPVVLRGRLWQLGDQKIGWVQLEKTLEGPIAQRFAQFEQRLNQYELDMKTVVTDCKTVASAVENQLSNMQTMRKQLAAVQSQVTQMQQRVNTTVENAIQRGMNAQEKKLGAKFDQIVALLSAKGKRARGAADDEEDAQMESPLK